MKIVLPDAPQAVSRQLVIDFLESLGLDARDVKGLEMDMHGIYVIVAARNEDGGLIPSGPNEIAKHRLYIEIAR